MKHKNPKVKIDMLENRGFFSRFASIFKSVPLLKSIIEDGHF